MTTADSLTALFERIADLRTRCPDFRFGQLIATIGMLAEDQSGHSLWDVEDAEFAAAAERLAADLNRSDSESR